MPLMNYTTEVAVEKTVAEIQRLLVEHGARAVSVEHEQPSRQPVSIGFLLRTRHGDQTYRIPVDAKAVLAVLEQQFSAGLFRAAKAKRPTQEQARKVAWRIVRDLLGSQLALLQAEMATLEEVMVPYAVLEDGRTVAEEIVLYGLPKELVAGERPILLPAPREAS